MEKPFSYSVYIKGRQYYQQNRVYDVNISDKTIEGTVHDDRLHKVKLVFNQKHSMIARFCDCKQAELNQECPHMAALYIKVMQNRYLDHHKETLRDLYISGISSKPKQRLTDYIGFETQVAARLQQFLTNKDWESIKAYCEEVGKLTYPSYRKENLTGLFLSALKTLSTDETIKEKMMQWVIDSLSAVKNLEFLSFFFTLIQTNTVEEQLNYYDLLLKSRNVMRNEKLSSRFLQLAYGLNTLSFDDFVKKYQDYKGTEIMAYFEICSCYRLKQYDQTKELIKQYRLSYPQQHYSQEIDAIYERIIYADNPEQYLEIVIKKLNFWQPDLREFKRVKAMLQESWPVCRNKIYDQLKERIDAKSFKNLILEQQEWEYALHMLIEEPSEYNLKQYLSFIHEYAPEMTVEVIMEYFIQAAAHANTYEKYEKIIMDLKQCRAYGITEEVLDFIIYFIKKLNPNKEKLIDQLIDLEVGYESDI